MKPAHVNKDAKKTATEWLTIAKEKETAKQWDEAIDAYRHIIKEHPKKEFAYQRLMILYRKKKEFKKELEVIETALDNFQYMLGSQSSENKKVSLLSKKLMKSTGLMDNKNGPAFLPEPLHKWTTRRTALKKLLSKQK
jgi:tetratricopeptide (TPR) repeat protein